MSAYRSIHIDVDQTSWPTGNVPSDIRGLASLKRWSCNIDVALLHTALWTRPPLIRSFDLSVFWAWLRYRFAISNGANLRLKREWASVDPHQKTLLGDELGVGFTAYCLNQHLGFHEYVDTAYFVNALRPGSFTLGRTARTGAKKSPDYIALGPSNTLNALECKGGQGSRRKVCEAVRGGVAQKQNLKSVASSKLTHSLVAGLFIPQASNRENACIFIRDPDWREIAELLQAFDQEELLLAALQIAYAKHFALMGLGSMAQVLAATPTHSLRRLEVDTREATRLQRSSPDEETLRSEFTMPAGGRGSVVDSKQVSRLSFEMRCSTDLYFRFAESQDVRALILGENQSERPVWRSQAHGTLTELFSPLGFTLALRYDYEV